MITGTFTGTGDSDTQKVLLGNLSISGTFSATIQLKRYFGGNWVTVETYTAPVEAVIDPGNGMDFKLTCSAYTSGTVTYALG